jgi:hypothetical protein
MTSMGIVPFYGSSQTCDSRYSIAYMMQTVNNSSNLSTENLLDVFEVAVNIFKQAFESFSSVDQSAPGFTAPDMTRIGKLASISVPLPVWL